MKVFELFSGIGGVHYALKESGCEHEIVRALDINTAANAVYKHNFPKTPIMQKNVQCLVPRIFDELDIDMITMSPPCQPYTRQGLQKGAEDTRNGALSHIMAILPQLTKLKYLLLENVVGFESSSSRESLINLLSDLKFRYQEFILSPNQFNIPNSRTRYYLLAKKDCFSFEEVKGFRTDVPAVSKENLRESWGNDRGCLKIGDILNESMGCLGTGGDLVPDNVLLKYGLVMDIVTKNCRRSCCFTKGYSRYAEGTGSVFCPFDIETKENVYTRLKALDKDQPEYLALFKSLELRYFSPTEVAMLMSFPPIFTFPAEVTERQKYRLLGNSVNVHVVACLIKLLFT